MNDPSVELKPKSPLARTVAASGADELAHGYGPRVHLIDDAHLATLLARISSPASRAPELVGLVRTVYRALFMRATGRELPRSTTAVPTRMAGEHPERGVWRGEVLDPATRAVLVDVVRAGIVPAQIGFEMLGAVLPPDHVRLDHLHLSRISGADGRVSGVSLEGSKIGGDVDGAVLFLPDPMGATGSTLVRVLEHYRDNHGVPAKVVAMPMISTPEFLERVLGAFPEVVVYTARLDRGLSDEDVLAQPPGARWAEERGLDDHGYIVPGAGGMGEVLNNSWC